MNLEIDPDVKAVAEFMQGNLPASRLVSVASAVAALAPILWGQHQSESICSLSLQSAAFSERDAPPPLPAST
jgi:hypothetical protein